MVPDLSGDTDAIRSFQAGSGPVIAGPKGYCVDNTNSRVSDGAGFVLLGGCDVLAGTRDSPRHRALLSASFALGDGLPSVAEYPALLQTDAGRALLSRAGDAATVEILSHETRRDTLFFQVRDTSPNPGAQIAVEHWRAAFRLGDHVVMLSVLSPAAAPLEARAARGKIESFADAVRRANR